MSENEEAVTDSNKQVEELRHANAVLQTENELFEIFLSQLESLSLASPLASQNQKEAGRDGKTERRATSQETQNLLNLEQKCYVALCELEETKKELKQLSTSLAKNGKNYKAAVEDSDVRLAEIKKERQDFERFVAKTQQTTPVQAQRALKVISYIERRIKAKEEQTERMHRRNRFLQTQIVKQQRMVHHKEQMQEKLCRIDLEHLKQKNIQCREILQQFQEQLLSQRLLVRKSQQGLNGYKEKLLKDMQESKLLSKRIASHKEKLWKIREQQQKAEKDQAQAEALNKKLRARAANYCVPDVMKYVESKVTNDQLRQHLKNLERKARIAEMSSQSQLRESGDSSGCSTSEEH